ncbi:GPCR kinase [Tanacetum coccineum]
MDFNFNNENEPWEFSLDIDDFDLHLTPVVHSSSITHVEPSPYTPNPVRIIPGPAGIVQLSSSTRVEASSSTPNPVRIIPGPAVTMKDLSSRTVHYKVIGKGGYGKDITVGAAIILANVSVFSPKPSMHYLNITRRNVVKVFCKDTVPGSGSG